MSTLSTLPAVLVSLALTGVAGTAGAKPDYINGGIGSNEVAQIEAQAHSYNLRLVFSEGLKNDYVSNVSLRVHNGDGSEVFSLDDAGPLTSLRLPPGRYEIDARFGSMARHNTIELKPGAPVDLYLHFPNDEKLS